MWSVSLLVPTVELVLKHGVGRLCPLSKAKNGELLLKKELASVGT